MEKGDSIQRKSEVRIPEGATWYEETSFLMSWHGGGLAFCSKHTRKPLELYKLRSETIFML